LWWIRWVGRRAAARQPRSRLRQAPTRVLTVSASSTPLSIDPEAGTPHHGGVVTPFGPAAGAVGRITVESCDGTRMLRLIGEIDEATIAVYQEEIGAERSLVATADGTIDVIDMAEVTFLSSAGVRFLIQQTREARGRGCRPTLKGLTNPARRTLQMTGVTSLFHTAA
jgi:anti-sigma B factor antagonist